MTIFIDYLSLKTNQIIIKKLTLVYSTMGMLQKYQIDC